MVKRDQRVKRRTHKTGRYNQDEMEYIAKHADSQTLEQIANHLNRGISSVKKYVEIYRTSSGPTADIDDPLIAPSIQNLQYLEAGFFGGNKEFEESSPFDQEALIKAAEIKQDTIDIDLHVTRTGTKPPPIPKKGANKSIDSSPFTQDRPSPEERDDYPLPPGPIAPTKKLSHEDVYLPNIEKIPKSKNPEIRELRDTWVWKNLCQEFSVQEILYFEERFIALCSQFKNDIMPSEQAQIFNCIKVELLMSRNLRERRRCRDEVIEMDNQREEFVRRFEGNPDLMEPEDRDYLRNLENQITAIRSAEQTRTNEYVKLSERHEKIMVSLKGTRDQRIKEIESSNKNWIGILKMFQERDTQEREGRKLELMKLATQREMDRLGRPTIYEDGNQDNPILTPETVGLGPLEDLKNKGDEELEEADDTSNI